LRSLVAGSVLGFIAFVLPTVGSAAQTIPEIRLLEGSAFEASVAAVTSGSLDARFEPVTLRDIRGRANPFWLRLQAIEAFDAASVPVLSVCKGLSLPIQIYAAAPAAAAPAAPTPLARAATLPEFGGEQNVVFMLSTGSANGSAAGRVVYARIDPPPGRYDTPRFSMSTLSEVLDHGAREARMITLAFGALMSMAIAGTLIWLLLSEKLFLLYGTLIWLQALYVAYLSGQGFEWPILSYARPLGSHAWNVPVALSGAVACLFVREISDLRRSSPRAYAAFGLLALAFVALAFLNVAKLFGFGALVNAIGNSLFLGSAIFTVIVAFLAWRRGSRPAGWFLIAWGLLEVFTILTALRLLNGRDDDDRLLYFGLPVAMVAAAVLIALGLADRLREQRVALTEAERRAQTDSLTGVLNRRSLIERLDAACLRARARGLPISLLFIDLDHFKEINDTFGHAAGDACLAAIIAPIQAELRQSDVIGRYGGEEFVVILSSADATAARPIAQRILERVASVRVEGFGEPIGLTCSIGAATSDMLGVWGEHLIARADAAVYVAKRAGRNRVQFALPLAA